MLHGDAPELLVGAVVLGAVHGFEPGHGWPVAASYALERANVWRYGLAASLLIGIGHLVSSIGVVLAFFYATAYFDLTRVNEPITLVGAVTIGGPVDLVAGVLLVALGIREYRHGHGHSHGHGNDGEQTGVDERGDQDHQSDHEHHDNHENHNDHEHHHDGQEHYGKQEHDHREGHGHQHQEGAERYQGRNEHARSDGDSSSGPFARVRAIVPFASGGGYGHGGSHDYDGEHDHGGHHERDRDGEHDHGHSGNAIRTDRGLLGIAWFAFLLGFAHEEEFEIIALCAGSSHCLELMTAYALTVIVAIVGLTVTLIAGYRRFEERVERLAPYLPSCRRSS